MSSERATKKAAVAGAALAAALLAALALVQSSSRHHAGPAPVLYTVASAHLDSQWRWAYPATISEYLPRTVRLNLGLIRRYPRYVFNFGGANRYRLLAEYHPELLAEVRRQVAAGRWFPSGALFEECDVNLAAPESVIRQVLYGGRVFRSLLGRSSAELMLPDDFGFPASLPTVIAHCGLRGFSTQKLTWGSSAAAGGPGSPQDTPPGIPFNVGFWEGVDGRGVVAALNPGPYDGRIWYDLSRSPRAAGYSARAAARMVDWPRRIARNGSGSGLFADFMYHGAGDRGGAPPPASLALLEAIVGKRSARLPLPPRRLGLEAGEALPAGAAVAAVGGGPVRVLPASAERMFLDIDARQAARLPRYRGEMQLREHSAGVLTSQGYVKRWNRRNEAMADAAERAALAGEWLGGLDYPRRELADAWALALAAQSHDILAGTCLPEAYEYSWNDQLLALNRFRSLLAGGAAAVAAALDTRTAGVPVVVFNPLETEREDLVEADAPFGDRAPPAVRVFDPDGREVPAQRNDDGRVVFLARVPAVGFAVFDLRPAAAPAGAGTLRAEPGALENGFYRVRLDGNGDVASVFAKELGRELLAAPLRLEIKTDAPRAFPAWNMEWRDQARPPRHLVSAPARVRLRERGPARVALEIERRGEGSRFVQTVRLAAGEAGRRLEFADAVDWRTAAAHLKAVFPLTAGNRLADYNLDVGVVRRPVNGPGMFEMAAQRWFDLSDAGGAFGVTVLSGSKYGSDRPDEHTLRLTLLRTPAAAGIHAHEATQDWGRHEFAYALAAHAGDWRRGGSDRQAYRLDQPLLPFRARRHAGFLGRRFSFMRLSHPGVRVLALKKAEEGQEIIVRLVESWGRGAAGARLAFAAPLLAAREVDGQERPLAGSGARLERGELVVDLPPFGLRAFAVTLAPPPRAVGRPPQKPLPLPADARIVSRNGEANAGGFDGLGRSVPAELLPAAVEFQGVTFRLRAAGDPAGQAVACRGQEIALPAGDHASLLVLAAAVGDRRAVFRVDGRPSELRVQDWGGFIGQWERRVWTPDNSAQPARAGLEPGFVKPAPVAWFATHRHAAGGGDEPYAYAYAFAFAIDLPGRARTLRLPDDPRVRVLAVTAVGEDRALLPLWPAADGLPPGRP